MINGFDMRGDRRSHSWCGRFEDYNGRRRQIEFVVVGIISLVVLIIWNILRRGRNYDG